MYTEIGASSTQSLRTLFMDAMARGKSKLHQSTDCKRFSKISRRTKNIAKIIKNNFENKKLFIFKIVTVKLILLLYKICNEKFSIINKHCLKKYIVTFIHNI